MAETKEKPAQTDAKVADAKPAESKGEVAQRPLDRFMAMVWQNNQRDQIANVLPKHVPFERFERNLANAIMQTPKLLNCPPSLVFREVSKLAALGLLLDPQLGEAYLIVGWNGKEKREEPQSRIGYRGFIKLARQTGHVRQLYAHEVCENDECVVQLGVDKKLLHKPAPFGKPRGAVVGYYAVVRLDDDESDFETMDIAQINAIRDRSDAWKAFQAKAIKTTPWSTDPDEMAKKTVLRRLMKRVPMSPDLADALTQEDRAEGWDGGGPVPPPAGGPPPRTATGALDGFAGRGAGPVTDIDPESGAQGGESGAQGGKAEEGGATPQGGAEGASGPESGAGAGNGAAEAEAGKAGATGGAKEAESGGAKVAGATLPPPPAEATGGPESGAGGAANGTGLVPMPPEVEQAWVGKGDAMPAYKWLMATLPGQPAETRKAMVDEHGMILRAIAGRAAGYRQRIVSFLKDHGIAFELTPSG